MRYQRLGRSGLVVSVVGLGLNNLGARLDVSGARAVIDAAQDSGVTLLDTADVYGSTAGPGASERILGEVIAGRRDKFVVATKFGLPMSGLYGDDGGARGSRRYIRRAVEGSLRRLRTDHIDLYQYHRPDGITPIEETLSALHELVLEGKVRYIGSSLMDGWQIADADWTAKTAKLPAFISSQAEYSLLRREIEAEILPAAQRFNVGLLPFFPLASGILTGKVSRNQQAPEGSRLREARFEPWLTDEAYDLVDQLRTYADERGISMLTAAIGWLAANPAVGSVIAGATSPEQIRANVATLDWQPSADDLTALNELAKA